MAFPIAPVLAILSPLLALKAVIHFKLRPYTDGLFAEKIDEIKDELRHAIIGTSKAYLKNFYFTAAIDAAVLFFAFIIFLLFKVNMISIIIFSLSIIVITVIYIIDMIKNMRLFMPYFSQTKLFIKDVLHYKSLRTATRKLISFQFDSFYHENTTPVIRKIHAIGTKIGAIKSSCDMKNRLIHELFSMATEKRLKMAVYPVIAIILFYGTFAFLVKLLFFSLTVQMNTIELVLYPFKELVPYLLIR